MPNFTYLIVYTYGGPGYQVFMDGKLIVDQGFDPEKPFVGGVPQPFDSVEIAEAQAKAVIAICEADFA